ncbi:unnamed protein product [Fasciola hepatica]|uniref:Uncharacterized protein n=1 Tax=Fasciola hepatica TaxID=6192 RepID=A0ABC9HJ28_FASHE
MTIIYFLFFSVIYLVWTSVEGETVRISMKDSKMLSELIDEFKSAVQQFTAVIGTNLREETKSLYESAWSIFRKSALELRRASTIYGVTRSGKAIRLTDRMKLTEDLAKIINAALSAANVMVQWCKVAKKNVLHSNPLWVMFDETEMTAPYEDDQQHNRREIYVTRVNIRRILPTVGTLNFGHGIYCV